MRCLTGPEPGESREIDRELVIGRQGDVVVKDHEASRRHAAVRPVAAGVEIEDLGSANGTFVDGTRVEGKVTVTRNAGLRIGQTELGIEVSLPQVTRVSRTRPPPVSDVTVARPLPPPPEVTGARPGGAAAESPPGKRIEWPMLRVLMAVGVAIIALVLFGVVLIAGTSGSKRKKAVAALKPHCAAHPPHFINDGFPEPRMVYSHDGVLNHTLKAGQTKIKTLGRSWPGMAYNGTVPGPTLVICRGDLVTLHLINDLPLDTNLHVHGLHVSPVGDGDNVFVDIHPLLEHTYDYQIPYDQSPGTFWYHAHYHPLVQPEVESGLGGGIIVEGSLDDEFPNVPQRLMMIQGGREVLGPPIKIPSAHLKPPPPAGPPELIVNGADNPTVKIAPGQLQRWRLVNATSDREVRLKIPGVMFELLAVDGITLQKMIPEHSLLIGPASRDDVLVRGPAPGTYRFISEKFQKCFKHCLDPFAGEGQTGAPDPQQTLMTVQSSGPSEQVAMPTGQLDYPASLGDLRYAHVDLTRKLYFNRVQKISTANAKVTFPLNDRLFDPNRVDVTLRLNSVEQWTLINPITGSHDEWHTFHIHQNPFQVISINGEPVNYVLWEDNVDLPPGSRIVVRMKPVDFVGKFVFHCHLLFHEDNGMMGVVQVLAHPTQAQLQQDRVMYMEPPDGRQLKALEAAVNTGKVRFGSSAWSVYEFYCHLIA